MKKKIIIIILFCFLAAPCLAQEVNNGYSQPLTDVYIKYQRVGWQEYEFWVLSNLPEGEMNNLIYAWDVDRKDMFKAKRLKYFFDKGQHVVRVQVTDLYGNTKFDTVKLEIDFWSLQNNWFWWALYLFLILIILYYWIVKLIYLFNRRRMGKTVRYFLDVLDEHGWVEKVVEQHVRGSKKQKSKKNKVK